MTDKEIRRLGRTELVSMLQTQAEENKELRQRLEQAQAQLDCREIPLDKAGTLAEAASQIGAIFESAQNDAAEYLENIKRFDEQSESICRQMEAEASEKAEQIRAEADSYSESTRAQADQYLRQVTEKVQRLLKEQESLRSLLAAFDANRKA